MDLRGYQYAVLLDWQELRPTAEQPWDRLCDSLNGAGVHNLEHALSRLRLRPLHEALEHALHPGVLRVLAELGRDLLKQAQKAQAVEPQKATEASAKEPRAENGARAQFTPHEELRLGDWLLSVDSFAWRAAEMLQPASGEEFVRDFREAVVPLASASLRLPLLERKFSTVWPGTVRTLLPSWEPGSSAERTWAPVLAWAMLRSLPGSQPPAEMFDQLQLREALGAIFSTSGMEGDDVWRAAARVRVLLAQNGESIAKRAYDRKFWDDPDVRWLAGVNESGGKTYFNQEATDELLAWMSLPALLKAAESENSEEELRELEEMFEEVRASAKAAGFELDRLLAAKDTEKSNSNGGGGAAPAEELPESPAVGKRSATKKVKTPGRD